MAWSILRWIRIWMCYEHFEHNEHSGASNCEEFLQYKRLYYRLKMDSAPRIYSGI